MNDMMLSEQCSRCLAPNLHQYCPVFAKRNEIWKHVEIAHGIFEGHCCEMREAMIDAGILDGPHYDELYDDLKRTKDEIKEWWTGVDK